MTNEPIFYRQLADHIGPFVRNIKSIYECDSLQNILIQFKNNPNWTAAHVAAELEIVECFENDNFMKEMENVLKEEELTPLHIACMVYFCVVYFSALVCYVKYSQLFNSSVKCF